MTFFVKLKNNYNYESGVMAFKYKEKLYTYLKDIQGNIIGIIDSAKTLIAKYEYDAWGNFTVYDGSGNVLGTSETLYQSTNAVWNINPFRYRGYYYDIETGLYYLLSRYYDPEVGRFISLDNSSYADPETINGLNLYLYCNNNPVMNVDPTGHSILGLLLWAIVGITVTASVNGVIAGFNAAEGESFDSAFAGGFVNGFISSLGLAVGLIFTPSIGFGIALTAGFLGGFVGNTITQKISYGSVNWKVAAAAGIISAGLNLSAFIGMSISGLYSTNSQIYLRILENLKLNEVSFILGFYLGTLNIFNPNELLPKRAG